MEQKKKILIIPGYDLFPIYFGGAYGQSVFLDLQQSQYNITVVISPDNVKPQDFESFKKSFPLITIVTTKGYFDKPERAKRKYVFFGKKTWPAKSTGYFDGVEKNATLIFKCRKDVVEAVSEIVSNEEFDIIQAEHMVNLGLINVLKGRAKKIYIHPEIFHTRIKQELEVQQFPQSYTNYFSENLKMLEYGLLEKYDAVFTVSEEDKEYLKTTGFSNPVHVSVSPVFKKDMNLINKPDAVPQFVFLGSENHYPNKHGLEWFFSEVKPRLDSVSNKFTLMITGWWSNDFKRKHQAQNVKFIGFVDDLDSVLQNTVLINPIFLGSGLRMKVIVCMCRGVPVLSTIQGAAGIKGLEDRKNILLEKDAAGFAYSITKLVEDKKLRSVLSVNGFALVEQEYNQNKIVAERNKIYETLFC